MTYNVSRQCLNPMESFIIQSIIQRHLADYHTSYGTQTDYYRRLRDFGELLTAMAKCGDRTAVYAFIRAEQRDHPQRMRSMSAVHLEVEKWLLYQNVAPYPPDMEIAIAALESRVEYLTKQVSRILRALALHMSACNPTEKS